MRSSSLQFLLLYHFGCQGGSQTCIHFSSCMGNMPTCAQSGNPGGRTRPQTPATSVRLRLLAVTVTVTCERFSVSELIDVWDEPGPGRAVVLTSVFALNMYWSMTCMSPTCPTGGALSKTNGPILLYSQCLGKFVACSDILASSFSCGKVSLEVTRSRSVWAWGPAAVMPCCRLRALIGAAAAGRRPLGGLNKSLSGEFVLGAKKRPKKV